MALDWNKEVSFSSITNLFKKGKGASVGPSKYPTKTTINLYQTEDKATDIRKVIAVGVLLVVLIGAFVKFGVFDQLALLSQKEGELGEQKSIAATAEAGAEGYDEVKEQFDSLMARYGAGSTDIISILDMVEQHVMKSSTVTAMVYADNTLTLTLYNVPLDTLGNLAKDLEGQDMVESVNVTTATTQEAEGQNTVSTIAVSLVGSGSEEK